MFCWGKRFILFLKKLIIQYGELKESQAEAERLYGGRQAPLKSHCLARVIGAGALGAVSVPGGAPELMWHLGGPGQWGWAGAGLQDLSAPCQP